MLPLIVPFREVRIGNFMQHHQYAERTAEYVRSFCHLSISVIHFGMVTNKTISGIALRKIDESRLSNIKLMCIDFYKLSDSLKEGIFDGIFLNFSDPWPKKRHTKRRLTSPNFLKAYYKVLKMNKYIYLKTDNEGFFDYSLEQFLNAKFKLNYLNRDYKEDFDFDALTEYEEKFLNKGVKIKKMIVERTEETNCEII